MHILVTGATGYIGGRLVPRLLERDHEISVLVRDPDRIRGREWASRVHVIEGDLLEPGDWQQRLRQTSFDAATYLVHSMYAGSDFDDQDAQAAQHFADAATHIPHTVYLGGLQPAGQSPSAHLSSRARTGRVLRDALPVTEFRAGPIIGSGSASFEMVRYLTERLPIMVTPKWVLNEVSPIAVRDTLGYLIAAMENEQPVGIVEIGCEPPLTFRAMMQIYAATRGHRRIIIPLPVLTPKLAALWVGLVTPITNRLAVPLVEGVQLPLVADTTRARQLFPAIEPIPYDQAVRLALDKIEHEAVETSWSGALSGAPTYRLRDWRGTVREERSLTTSATPEQLFHTICSIGGKNGWLTWSWAWQLRGLIDLMAGGPGLRRGRRHPSNLLPGEALDFWRVEAVDRDAPGMRLLLRAEMKVPGKAWLQFEVHPEESGSRLVQTAIFVPNGFSGALYWYALYPLHRLIFSDMAKALVNRAENHTASPSP